MIARPTLRLILRAVHGTLCAAAVAVVTVADAAAQTSIAYVQSNSAVPQTPQTVVNVALTAAQTAGNLNVVVVGWNDATAHVLSVTDTKGNTYVTAVGPTVRASVATQTIYYARNVLAAAANTNSVRVSFDRAAAFPDVRVAEYRGLDPVAPLDAAVGATGSSTASNSGSVTTTNANDLLIGANLVLSGTTGAGTGFTSRVITKPDGDILEDRIVTSSGSYQATAPLSKSAAWIMQIAAFKAATGSVVPDVVVTSQHTGNFTQGQLGAAYTLRASNNGAGPTSGTVTVTDTLPGGLTATTLAGTGWTCAVATLTCTRSDALGAGAIYPVITLTVNVAATAPASVANAAAVAGGGETNTANDTATDVTTIVQVPDLSVGVTHAGSFAQGQTGAAYTLTVSNVGTGTTAGVVSIADSLPSGLTATSMSGSGWTCVLSTITCTRSTTLAGGASYPGITLTVSVASNAPSSVSNAATVSGGGEANTANDTATDVTTIAQIPDLSLTMTHGGSFTQGQSGASYSLTAANGGFGPTTGVVTVTDLVPAGLTTTAAGGVGWNCTLGTPVTCTRADALSAGLAFPSIVVTVAVAPNAPATVTNTASVGGGGETNTVNDGATDVTPIVQLPDLTVGATHVGAFRQGQSGATYTLQVFNAGTGPTAGVITVSDALPPALTATAASGTGWSCSLGAPVLCTRTTVIAPGGTAPAISVTVGVGSDSPASVTNTATVSGGGESNLVNDVATDVTAVAQAADMTVSATHAGSFVQGQAGAIYTITVINGGPGATSGAVTLVDSLPGGLTATALAGTGWSCTLTSAACSRNDALPSGASYPAITLAVNVAPNAPASVINIATVGGGGELDASNDSATDLTAIVQLPDVIVTSAHGGVFTQGQSGATYTLTVSNTGAGPTTNVVSITDALPGGLTATALIGSGWSCTLASLTCARSDALPTGASYPPIVLTIDVAMNAASVVINTASVAGGGESNAANDTASDVTTVLQLPDLAIAETHAAIFMQGQTGATYTLTVSNVGSGSTTGVVTIVDPLPAALTATGATGTGWTCDVGGTVTCQRNDPLAAGMSYAPILLSVNVAGDAPESVTHTAGVSEASDPNPANNTVSALTIIGRPSDLTVTQTHGGSFTQGQHGATYSLTVSNTGTGSTVGAVSLIDILPAGLTATTLTGAGWTCTLAGVACARSDALADGASYPAITLTVDVAPTAPAIVTATATVSGGGEIDAANDSAADVTAVVQVPDLTVTSAHGAFAQGQRGAAYLLTVSNSGAGDTSGVVTVGDAVPVGLTPTSLSGPGWGCSLDGLTCSRNDSLAPGASYPGITLTVDVAANAPANVTNTVSVSGGGEWNPANDAASDVTAIVQLPDLTMSIAHGSSFVQGQTGATYALTVSNSGAGPTSGVVMMADTLPDGLMPTAVTGAGWSCTLATLVCTRADALAPGAAYPVVVLTVDVAPTAPASVTNVAATSGGGEANIANDSASNATPVARPSDLTVTSTHAAPFTQGQTSAAYLLTVANAGAGPSSGSVTVTDLLPQGLTPTGLAGPGWSCAIAGITCSRSDVLAEGASYPAVVLTVAVAATAPESVTNTATVSGGGEVNPANDSTSDLTAIIQLPDLTLSSSHGSFAQGQTGATYSLLVSNAANAPTDGIVTVTDLLPSALTATAMTGTGWNCTLASLTCSRTDVLAAGTSYPAVVLTVDVAPNAPASVTNLSNISGGGEANIVNDAATDVTAIAQLPDLALTIAHGSFVRGQAGAIYTLVVSNAGAAATSGSVIVADALPGGLTATALAGAGWSCTLATLTCTRADVLAAGSGYPGITLTVTVAGDAASSVIDIATVSGDPDLNTANNSVSDVTTIALPSDLTVALTHGGAFSQGQTGAAYTVTVSNGGSAPTAGPVTVADSLPAGLTATSLTGSGWTCGLAGLTCSRNDALASGSSFSAITLTVDVAPDAPAAVTNVATVSGGGEADAANDTATDATSIAPAVDLTLAKTHVGAFARGQSGATYFLTVSNAALGATAGTVTVTDALPPGLTATSMSGTGWNCTLGAPLTCTRTDVLAGNASYPVITLTVDVSPTAPGSITNTASVSVGGEANTANNAASDFVQIGTAFPLKLSGNHRYLVDQNNRPVPILGRTAWFVISLSVPDYHTFVDDSVSRGYNAIEMHVLDHDPRGNHPPFDGNLDAPFLKRLDGTNWNGALGDTGTGAPDFTTPNEAYWSFVDGFLNYCQSQGVSVFVFPAYAGFQGGEQGWLKEMVANGPARMQAYGSWLATRYKNQGNLVWMLGGDMGTAPFTFDATQTAVENALLIGIKSVMDQQTTFFSAEWSFESTATDQTSFGTSMSLNGIYSFSGYVSLYGRQAYAYSPVEPAFLLEEPYDEEGADGVRYNLAAVQPTRQFQWWGWLSTIGGYISGNGYVWPFNSPDWQNHLDTQGARDMARLNAFIKSIAWSDLVPSGLGGMKNLVTVGGGGLTLDNYVAAAATPTGSLLVAYVPPNHTGSLTIDMTAMGAAAQARWFNPATAISTPIVGSPFANTGTRQFTPPGNNGSGFTDWVLVLEASLTPDTTRPSIPTNLAGTGVSPSQITLSWTASTDDVAVQGYAVFRGGIQIGTTPVPTFADTGLSPGTTYSYAVSAFDAAGNASLQSGSVPVTTALPDTIVPTVPVSLQASNVTSSSATLSWASSTDNVSVAGYRVFRNGTLIGVPGQNGYSDSGLSPATTYSYTVAAFDTSGNVSAASQALNVTTATLPQTPPAFVQLQGATATASGNTAASGAFKSPTVSGHLIVVWAWYKSGTQSVSAMTDSAGNTYAKAVGPTTGAGGLAGWRQELWYARNIVGGSGVTVTATFTASFNAEKSISAHEYAGIDTTAPLDVTAAATTTAANASSGAAAITIPNELIFGASLFASSGTSGAGFTQRSSIAQNASEDKVVTAIGSYSATFSNSSQSAIAQMATFKAASVPGGTMSFLEGQRSLPSETIVPPDGPRVVHSESDPSIRFGQPVIDDDGALYVARTRDGLACGSDGCGSALQKIVPGGEGWTSADLGGGTGPLAIAIAPGNRVHVQDGRNALHTFESNGTPAGGLWPVETTTAFSGRSAFGSIVDWPSGEVFEAVGDSILALRPDGRELWHQPVGIGASVTLGPGRDLYVGNNGHVIRFDRETGAEICRAPVESTGGWIGTADGLFSVVGSTLWQLSGSCASTALFALGDATGYSLHAYTDGRIFGFEDRGPRTQPYDAMLDRLFSVGIDGGAGWLQGEVVPATLPIRAIVNGVLYVLGLDREDALKQKLFLISAATGDVLDRIDVAGMCQSCGVTVSNAGTIYLNDLRSTSVFQIQPRY